MKESAEMGNTPHKASQENPDTVLTSFFQDLYSTPTDQLDLAHAERTHWVELGKIVGVDCAVEL